jgi:hypothetical protein
MKMRLACTEVDQVGSRRTQFVGFRHDGHGGRNFNAINAIRQLNCSLGSDCHEIILLLILRQAMGLPLLI